MICQLNISIIYQLFIVNNLDMVVIEHMQTLHMFIAYLEHTRVQSFEKLKLLFMYVWQQSDTGMDAEVYCTVAWLYSRSTIDNLHSV